MAVIVSSIVFVMLFINVANAQLALPAVTNTFTGCSVEGHGGWASANSSATYRVGALTAGADLGASGGMFGLGLGCDIQMNNFVFGVHGNYDWLNMDSTVRVGSHTAKIAYDNQWAVYGRLGYVITDSTMVYGLLGFTELDADTLRVAGFGRKVGSFNGATYGLGVETALNEQWRFGLEARRDDLNGKTLRHVAYPGDKLTLDPDNTTIRAVLRFRFGGTQGLPPPLK